MPHDHHPHPHSHEHPAQGAGHNHADGHHLHSHMEEGDILVTDLQLPDAFRAPLAHLDIRVAG
jgi:hypothetical protein